MVGARATDIRPALGKITMTSLALNAASIRLARALSHFLSGPQTDDAYRQLTLARARLRAACSTGATDRKAFSPAFRASKP